MRALGLRQSPYLPITAFLIVLACFLLYHNSEPGERDERMGILLKPRSTYHSQGEELVQVLRRASMSDRKIILTMVDETWASPGSILGIFLQSFKSGEGTQKLLNHLVIITMDPKAFEYCMSVHPHCIHPSTFARYFVPKIQSIRSPDHNIFSWRRNNVLLDVLALGYNIIFTNADVLWLRSPLSQFYPTEELTISCNFSSDGQGRGYMQDGGIFFLKASAIAFEFFKYWKLVTVLYPHFDAQESLCITLVQSQDIVGEHGFRVKYVDTTHFGGFCQLNKDMLREVDTIHANCCDDLASKVHDLKIVLDDWIHFREYLSGDNTSDKMDLWWRAPQKCMIRKT